MMIELRIKAHLYLLIFTIFHLFRLIQQQGADIPISELLGANQVIGAINRASDILQNLEPEIKGILKLDNRDVITVYDKPFKLRKLRLGFIKTIASDILKESLIGNLNKYDFGEYLENFDVSGTPLDKECPYKDDLYRGRECDPFYREIDGFCNNLKNPTQGMAHSVAKRFLPPDYGDGLNTPRLSMKGEELPLARLISTKILMTRVIQDPEITNGFMVFGQFLDHEIALASSPSGDKLGVVCCQRKNLDHPSCLPILIPPNDYFYSKFNVTCLENVRSPVAIGSKCRLGPSQHNNEVTSYIDASPIYGSTAAFRDAVRLFDKGLLKTQQNPYNPSAKPLLPPDLKNMAQCLGGRDSKYQCFLAGDERVNQNSMLISMHHIFLRQHNEYVLKLAEINPKWNDEKLFLEGRRIIGAIMQHIVYNEYVPIAIGNHNVKKYKLGLEETGYFTGYDESIDASIEEGFTVSAFRFGHTQINAHTFRVTPDRQAYSPIMLRSDFFRPENIYIDRFPKGIDPILRGYAQQHIQQVDQNFAEDVHNHLFEAPDVPFGLDLPALNILRGRDHGIPAYNEWREFCGLERFPDFDSMEAEMYKGVPENLAKIYEHPDDIDFFVGGVSELSQENALAGPTMACVIALQFHNLRYGDRFWYENHPQPGVVDFPFKPEQLQEIRKMTLSKIVCDNSDNVPFIQKHIFKQPSL